MAFEEMCLLSRLYMKVKMQLQLLTSTARASFLTQVCKPQTRDELLCRGHGPGHLAVPVNVSV